MKLTEKEKESAIEKIDMLALPDVKCPVCGEEEWYFNEYILETREFLFGDIALNKGVLVPYVTMSCKKCSNTFFFNAVQLGIVNPESVNKKKEGQSETKVDGEKKDGQGESIAKDEKKEGGDNHG